MEQEHYNLSAEENQEGNIKDVLQKYLRNWKWFLLSIAVSMILGFVYLRYQAPVYEVSATILIKDDKKGASSELSAFDDLGILKNNNNIDNEIEILKSRSLMMRVVKELKLNVSYFSYGRPIEHERYTNTPVIINYTTNDSTIPFEGNWLVNAESKRKFVIKNGETKEVIGTYSFGDSITTEKGKIVFTTTSFFTESYINKDFRVIISPIDVVVDNYLGAVKVEPVNKNSNAIVISLRNPLKDKAKAIVNNLIKQHNLDAIEDKNEVSRNTANFINERIKYITTELSDVEGEAENFKTKNKLTDIISEAELFLKTGNESEMSLVEAGTQLKLVEYMYEDLLKRTGPSDLIPGNLGLQDASIATTIAEYNKIVVDRNRILKSAGEKNPLIENIDSQLLGIRGSLKESLANLKTALVIKINELNKQEGGINSKIASVPKYEREFRIIQRQQQIKEALYLYLLQKREETNIALAVTVSNAKIIDAAHSNGKMVAPRTLIIQLLSFLIGALLPVLFFYLADLLDTKVHGKKDIDKLKLPFLGDIPLSDSKNKIVVSKGDNSGIAEAFRLLRTNVDFMLGATRTNGKTIFVTSTIGKEGKSFVALNLASSLALSGKKVILVGMDLRAPKILRYLNLEDKKGLTDFIMTGDQNLPGYIFRTPELESLDILPSGSIPPNPSELLMNPGIKVLFDSLKGMYDYIVVDTAPVGMVTDTLLLSAYADVFVFVVRANYLDKRLLSIAETIYKEKRLSNMAVLINGSDHTKGYGYGYGYGGYGYGAARSDKWWKRNK
jgi:capsular exopolysaccharide synthesis family protein